MSSKLKIDCYWYPRVLSPQVKLVLLEVAILQLSSCGGVVLNGFALNCNSFSYNSRVSPAWSVWLFVMTLVKASLHSINRASRRRHQTIAVPQSRWKMARCKMKCCQQPQSPVPLLNKWSKQQLIFSNLWTYEYPNYKFHYVSLSEAHTFSNNRYWQIVPVTVAARFEA